MYKRRRKNVEKAQQTEKNRTGFLIILEEKIKRDARYTPVNRSRKTAPVNVNTGHISVIA